MLVCNVIDVDAMSDRITVDNHYLVIVVIDVLKLT